MGALASLDSKAQLGLLERGGAGGTAPGGFLVAEDRKGFGERAQIGDPLFVLTPPVTRTSWGVPDSGFIRHSGRTAGRQPRQSLGSCQDNELIAPLQLMVAQAERIHIRRALHRCEGSVSRTAELLGISRKTLWDKMKRLEISA